MKKILSGALLLVASILASMYMAACSSDDDSSNAVSTTTYGGPGSQWTVALSSNNTFTIEYAETVGGSTDMTVSGTYETLTSGYLRLTVTSASGTDAPPAGAQAYAMNIPGFVLLLKPLDADSEIIPMIATGTCPTTQTDFNWVVSSHEASGEGSSLEDGRDLLGSAQFNGSDAMSLTAKFDLEGDSLAASDPAMSGTCSNGIITLDTGDGTAAIWLSTSGAGLVQVVHDQGTPDTSDDEDDVIVAMPQAAISDIADLDGDYIGIVFNDGASTDKTEPVYATFDSTGTNTAGAWTDVDAGTRDTTNTLTIGSITIDSPASGFFRATLTDNVSSDAAPMSCQVTKNAAGTGRNIIFCVGIDPDDYTNDDGDQLYSVMLVQQP